MKILTTFLIFAALFVVPVTAQPEQPTKDESDKIDKVMSRAVERLGGDNYLSATTLSSRGKLSILKDGRIDSFQSFVDVVIFPDTERTDFSQRGAETVQVNVGNGGWIYDELFEVFDEQTEKQKTDFARSLKSHYDYLLRGFWEGNAELSHRGRRSSGIGRRNDVLRLEFGDGFWVEYEFADSGSPMKTVYPSKNAEGVEILEENRYAQFILTNGIFFPFIVDHFVDGKRSYRINYVEVMFNKRIPESVFEKPKTAKQIKKLKI